MMSPETVHSGSQPIEAGDVPSTVSTTPRGGSPSASNAQKLRMLCEVLGLRPADVARATGTSKALISMILGGSRPGSPAFWFAMEHSLGRLVEERPTAVFAASGTFPIAPHPAPR